MRHAQAQRPPITGAAGSARGTPTVMDAAARGIPTKLRRPVRSRPMRSASMTCLAMYCSGWRTAFTITTMGRLRMVRRGRPAIARPVSPAEVPGAPVLKVSAQPPAVAMPPSSGMASLASVSGGRLPLESARARSRRARAKCEAPSIMSMARARVGRPIPRRRLSWSTCG